MALPYSRNLCLQFSEISSALFQIFIFFMLLIPFSNPISFNFSSFDDKARDSINLERDAKISASQDIQLNEIEWSSGRATYRDPVRLWNKETGTLTDFTTQFSFYIDSLNDERYADGMAFFLAPNGSALPSKCCNMGIFKQYSELDPLENQVVAVEFDTYGNEWDPVPSEDNWSFIPYHVGIDINSARSVATANWTSTSFEDGKMTIANISYNSSTKNLSVSWTYADNPTSSLSFKVDLKNYLPEWVMVGFSGSTGRTGELHVVRSWYFYSSLQVESSDSSGGTNWKTKMVVGVVVGASMSGLGVISFILWIKRKRQREEEEEEEEDMVFGNSINEEFERGIGPKRFLYGELVRATNNFAEGRKLGEGGFGGVYKGFLSDLNMEIAVKRISQRSKQGIKEYMSEVKIISQVRHKNLVQLVGWCHQRKELLLVYEFMPNGSLDSHLFGQKEPLGWEVRYKIALGLASALFYLHEEWEQCIVHRDIKSSNVMLDANFNAKLGDFGLARLVDHGQRAQTTVLAGTMGYMAPECVATGKSSKESDVYSFGIVALEIACGRRPIEPWLETNKVRLIEWVWELYGREMLVEGIDPRLTNMGFDEKQLKCLMVVGLWCAHPDSNLRPSIKQVMLVLSFEAPLPTLPPKMPVPTNYAATLDMHNVSNPPSANNYSFADISTTSILYPR
ncbi:PREDICTED: L-type lectin-domain containing receptor kinase IX.1-like [Nelumbo nucifera]|uniref:non-specific serine/threonine protein kinase n=2 Tax=Nelumbo nucifera TaxID=4432 RepID=A0A1U8AZL7_NELNU|nr:PREDICTED: L-type lectin-domain containing receptor kinase IX.1-like [Nelumbo nucifera]DAD45400.1 TPA_asm: hypothetical protein HUJ06_003630 [Nelumbo nucifera]